MKKETKIYTEYCIRNQIAAGGSGDWQIRLGEYIVSLQYVDCPGDGFLGRLASLAGRVPPPFVLPAIQGKRIFSRRCISEKSRRSDQCHPANIGSGEGGQHYDRQCDGFETVRA